MSPDLSRVAANIAADARVARATVQALDDLVDTLEAIGCYPAARTARIAGQEARAWAATTEGVAARLGEA